MSSADVKQAPALGLDTLHDLLRASELDLAAARERCEQATAAVSHHEREVSHLEKHAASLDAELQKLRRQAVSRDEELCELRERLAHARLAATNARSDLSVTQTERADLVRGIARLHPQAQSNRAALRVVADLQADLLSLEEEQIECRDKAALRIDELERECARLRQVPADAAGEPSAVLGTSWTFPSFMKSLVKSKNRL